MEMAIVKRTAKNTKSLRTKRDKLIENIKRDTEELERVKEIIQTFEAPIVTMTGGLTSEEVMELGTHIIPSNDSETGFEPVDTTEIPLEDPQPYPWEVEDAIQDFKEN